MEFKKATWMPLFPFLGRARNGKTSDRMNKKRGISHNHLTTTHYKEEKRSCAAFYSIVSFLLCLGRTMRKCVWTHNRSGSPISCRLNIVFFFFAFAVEQHIYGFIMWRQRRKFFRTESVSANFLAPEIIKMTKWNGYFHTMRRAHICCMLYEAETMHFRRKSPIFANYCIV